MMARWNLINLNGHIKLLSSYFSDPRKVYFTIGIKESFHRKIGSSKVKTYMMRTNLSDLLKINFPKKKREGNNSFRLYFKESHFSVRKNKYLRQTVIFIITSFNISKL